MPAQTTTPKVDEAFLAVYEIAAHRTLNRGRVTRLIARARSSSLDQALARGDDPVGSPQLAARAAALTARRARDAIADQLERLLDATAAHPRGHWRVHPRRTSITANAGTIRELTELMRGTTPLYARGVAMLKELLRDGGGPVYVGDGGELATRLAHALVAMRS